MGMGGIWGRNNLDGNFGNSSVGTSGFAYTASAGGNTPYNHIPKSYGVVSYICV